MNASDYDGTPITVTFLPGKTEVDVKVPIVTDSIEEGLETFVLMLEVDENGIVFPAMPLLAQVNIKEQQSMYAHTSLQTVSLQIAFVCACTYIRHI